MSAGRSPIFPPFQNSGLTKPFATQATVKDSGGYHNTFKISEGREEGGRGGGNEEAHDTSPSSSTRCYIKPYRDSEKKGRNHHIAEPSIIYFFPKIKFGFFFS